MTGHVSPRRYLALWFPFLPTDRIERTRPAGDAPAEPLVLHETVRSALRITALNRRAIELGLTTGLTLADARARLPKLEAVEREPRAEEALLVRLAETCDRWTPLVALDAPHGLTLDVTGCAHLFGGEADLRQKILDLFRAGGFSTRAAIAGTPDAARALARYGRTAIVPALTAAPYPSPCKGEDGPSRQRRVGWGSARIELDPDRSPPCPPEEAAVRPLPVAALGLDEEMRGALSLAGLKRISDLLDRPSRPLAARFGEELVTKLRRVCGREDVRITPLRAPPALRVEKLLADPIASTDAIEAALEELVARAASMLEARGEGGRAFEAAFFRTDGAVRRVAVATGKPSRDRKSLMRLFRERLDTLADPLDPGFGFDLIRLSSPIVERLDPAQPDFDRDMLGEDEVADLLDRLAARFGPSRVLRFASADSHDPLRASALVPAAVAQAQTSPWPEAEPGEPPLRPMQMFDPPQPIETLAETPDGPPVRFRWRRVLHSVARAEGPERIAAEWWRSAGGPTRDYYRVEDEDGRRYWIFRAGLYGQEADEPRWFLHGLFA